MDKHVIKPGWDVLSIPVQWTMSDEQEQFEYEHSRHEIQNEHGYTQT